MVAGRHGGLLPGPLPCRSVPPRPLEIRPVRPDEHAAAGALVVAAYRALPGLPLDDGYAGTLADVGLRDGDGGTEVLVALDAGELAGCVTFVPGPGSPWAEQLEEGEASIRMLAVDPAAQGRGVGRGLLDACVERARHLGRTGVFLHSTPWMTAAHHLYADVGFVRVPGRDWSPSPEVPLLAFRLALDPAPDHAGRRPGAAGAQKGSPTSPHLNIC